MRQYVDASRSQVRGDIALINVKYASQRLTCSPSFGRLFDYDGNSQEIEENLGNVLYTPEI